EQVVHVERLQGGPGAERFQLWTAADGRVRTATVLRRVSPARLRIAIDADPDGPPLPFAGRWSFHPLDLGRSEVVLHHLADVPGAPDVLAALNRVAGQGHQLRDVLFSFTDTLRLDVEAEQAYAFVADAGR